MLDSEVDMQVSISKLPANPAGQAIYRRANGKLYLRLNESLHFPVRAGDKPNQWVCTGDTEVINPDEVVEVKLDEENVK